MGNKRKLISHIEHIIVDIKNNLKKDTLVIADLFSGSGIVSRMFLSHSHCLLANDTALYSKILQDAYLFPLSKKDVNELEHIISCMNAFVDSHECSFCVETDGFISKHWSEGSKRLYYSRSNGIRIDLYRQYIDCYVPEKYKVYVLAPLLIESSIHTNTCGHFASFYKDGLGGKKSHDLTRITSPIRVSAPIQPIKITPTRVVSSQMDACEWAQGVKNPSVSIDVVYLDPPYNKHPYHIYYFLLNMIAKYDTTIDIPDTTRGQPRKWKQSAYNSTVLALKEFNRLISLLSCKYIIMSYSSRGILKKEQIERILSKKGQVKCKTVSHGVYRRLEGLAHKHRITSSCSVSSKPQATEEYIWICRVREE